jgi:hypothetical protein
MFKINRDNHAKDFYGRDNSLNESFESAKNWFDGQEHESMTRKPLKTDTVKKMVNPKIVIAACLMISGAKQAVDRLVV